MMKLDLPCTNRSWRQCLGSVEGFCARNPLLNMALRRGSESYYILSLLGWRALAFLPALPASVLRLQRRCVLESCFPFLLSSPLARWSRSNHISLRTKLELIYQTCVWVIALGRPYLVKRPILWEARNLLRSYFVRQDHPVGARGVVISGTGNYWYRCAW